MLTGTCFSPIPFLLAFIGCELRARTPMSQPLISILIHVLDAAVDQDTSPPVVLRMLDGVVAKNGAAHAAATVNHEDPTVAFLLEELADQDVVLLDLERDDGAGEDLAPSVDLEDGLERAELAVHDQVRVSVAYFGGGQWQGSHIFFFYYFFTSHSCCCHEKTGKSETGHQEIDSPSLSQRCAFDSWPRGTCDCGAVTGAIRASTYLCIYLPTFPFLSRSGS
jgi:hypothetical protein